MSYAKNDASQPAARVKITELEKIIEYTFKDKVKAWEAIQLPGNGFATRFIHNGNKRLAVVGDLVLDLIMSEEWYRSGLSEG